MAAVHTSRVRDNTQAKVQDATILQLNPPSRAGFIGRVGHVHTYLSTHRVSNCSTRDGSRGFGWHGQKRVISMGI